MIFIGVMWIIYFFMFIVYLYRKRKWAIRKVKITTDCEKLCYINLMLEPFGFEFDIDQDIIISRRDCWQRDFGYMDLYDDKSPFFNMVIVSLPVCFDYEDKQYRIEFWKGQYGIALGAEIGVYVRDRFSKYKIYQAVSDEDSLHMQFSLYKDCKLFSRCDKSWWLTGFDIGKFSATSDLKMSVCICFPNQEMLGLFISSLINAGYSSSNIDVCDNMVCFDYCFKNNYRPNHQHKFIKFLVQIRNHINCKWYLYLTKEFNRTLDKLTFLRYMAPRLYGYIIKISIPRHRKAHKKNNWLKK